MNTINTNISDLVTAIKTLIANRKKVSSFLLKYVVLPISIFSLVNFIIYVVVIGMHIFR